MTRSERVLHWVVYGLIVLLFAIVSLTINASYRASAAPQGQNISVSGTDFALKQNHHR